MNPALEQRARDGAAIARSIASEISSSNPVSKSAAVLAADCLELAVAPFSWQSAHDIVRDLGVRSLRESVQRDCAAALLIAADSARRLAVHGASAERHAGIASRLEQLASDLMRVGAGLDQCEVTIIDRLKEPRLAQISLQQRVADLRLVPSTQNNRIRQLSTELEKELAQASESRALLTARESLLNHAREELRANAATLAAAESELERLKREAESTSREISDMEFLLDDLRRSREQATQRLTQVRAELESMRADPRDSIRDAVHRALALLPSDAFDQSVGSAHER